MGFRTPVDPNSATFTPGVRLMMICIAIGMMIGWPLMRLSQPVSPYPIRQTLLDLFVLFMLVQVVIWPLRLVTIWSPLRTAAIDATLGSWMFYIGAIVAAAISTSRPGVRALAMLACISIVLLGPALTLAGIFSGADWMALIELSPLMAISTLGQGGGTPPTEQQWKLVTALAIGGILVWVVLLVVALIRKLASRATVIEN